MNSKACRPASSARVSLVNTAVRSLDPWSSKMSRSRSLIHLLGYLPFRITSQTQTRSERKLIQQSIHLSSHSKTSARTTQEHRQTRYWQWTRAIKLTLNYKAQGNLNLNKARKTIRSCLEPSAGSLWIRVENWQSMFHSNQADLQES